MTVNYRTPVVTSHAALSGLAADDHPQYHNNARALTWLGGRSTSDLPEGSHLYYTDARADARVALGGVYASAKDAGILGNGLVDETAAIRAWLNTGLAAGATAYFPNGTYLTSSAINIPTGRRILGENRSSTLFKATTNGQTIFTVNYGSISNAYVTISDVGFVVSVANVTGISTIYAGYLSFHDLYFQGCNANINIDKTYSGSIRSILSEGSAALDLPSGCLVVGSTTSGGGFDYTFYVNIDDYEQRNSGTGIVSPGVLIRRGVGITLQYRCSAGSVGSIGVQLDDDCQDVKVWNSTVGSGAQGFATVARGGNYPTYVEFINCDADQCSTAGIHIADGAFIKIMGGNFTNGSTGVWLDVGCGWVNVSSVQSSHNSIYGVLVGAGVNGFRITDCTIVGQLPVVGYGIVVNAGASDKYNIIGNDCSYGFNVGGGVIDYGTGVKKFIVNNLVP